MKTSDFEYELPTELIAQQPASERTQARMMVIRRDTGSIEHRHVSDLPEWLKPGDLLVVNDTRVFPARVFGCKEGTGGRVEILLIEETAKHTWEALVRASRAPRVGASFSLASGRLQAQVVARHENGRVELRLAHDRPLFEILEQEGVPPLPPYIKRPRPDSGTSHTNRRASDATRYQTVYAKVPGAIAAPTAGLHFSVELLDKLERQGVRHAAITLHVGPGTFVPVKTEDVEQHRMEAEKYIVSPAVARLIRETLDGKGRLVAVGSTVVRTLETVASEHGSIVPAQGRSSLFIVPPYSFKAADAMLTNFHLPVSTVLMMVSAFTGIDLLRRAYQLAIEKRYRFYSYGDCMLIL